MEDYTIESLAYAAGIIDGEGSIIISKTIPRHRKDYQFRLKVTVGNTNELLILWMQAQFDGHTYKQERPVGDKRKDVYYWYLHGREASNFLELVYPYLCLKRPQAEIAICFQGKEADQISMRSLNKKGK